MPVSATLFRMQIVYCEKCGKRITDATQAHQDGEHWICLSCRPATASADPVSDDPERGRSTVMAERGVGAASSGGQTKRRAPMAQGSRGRADEAPAPSGKNNQIIWVAVGGGALVLVLAYALLGGGGKNPPAENGGKEVATSPNSGVGSSGGMGTSTSLKTTPATPQQPPTTPSTTPATTPTHTPGPGPAPVGTPATTPAVPDPAPAVTRPPAPKETEAREKFAPLKADFERARAAGDLKALAKISGDLGFVTRDYDGTPAAGEAMALIKQFNELKAVERLKEAAAEFRKAKNAARSYNVEVAEAIGALRRVAKETAGTAAAADAESDIKTYLDSEAGRVWNKAKPNLAETGPAGQEAVDDIGILIRDFPGTDAEKEASKALAEQEKKAAEASGSKAYLTFQSQLRHAKDPKTLRELIGQIRSFMDGGLEADANWGELLPRGLRMLDQALTPASKQRVAAWKDVWSMLRDFTPIEGAKGDASKDGDKPAAKFTSKGGEIRILYALNAAEDDTLFKLSYKASGLKNLTLRFVSSTHRETFEFAQPSFKNDAVENLALPLATVKKEKKSLHNAWIALLEIRAEKAKPDDAAAALLFLGVELTAGRGK
ncbi:MAG: hypothetical protein HY291_00125 [Planctomycetes bacterium]|nr:hypothetical protein [Planctomycetota bacterium]